MQPDEEPETLAAGHDSRTRSISVAGALSALAVLLLHAWLGPRYHAEDPAGDLFSNQLSVLAGITVASFLTTAPERRGWVYAMAFPSALCGVVFPWLHALAPDGSTAYRLLNALSPVGMALLGFGVTWALRLTAAEDAARIAARHTRRTLSSKNPSPPSTNKDRTPL